jgi:hypothetical protein
VRWFYDGNEISKSAGKSRKTVTDNGHLRIHHTRKSDRGIYLCKVNLTKSMQSRKIKLVIHEKPTIVNTSSPHQHFLVGQNVVFYCEGVGRPDPRTLWLRNGKKINNADSARYTVISEYDTRSSWLLIKNAKLHDAGNYTCRLLNSHGHQDFTATLTVQDPPNKSPPIPTDRPIIFNLTPRRIVSTEGQNVTLSCTASNDYDNTSIAWESNVTGYLSESVSVVRKTFTSNYFPLVTSCLTLTNIRPTSNTQFICTATNHVGNSTAVIKLSVQPNHILRP